MTTRVISREGEREGERSEWVAIMADHSVGGLSSANQRGLWLSLG